MFCILPKHKDRYDLLTEHFERFTERKRREQEKELQEIRWKKAEEEELARKSQEEYNKRASKEKVRQKKEAAIPPTTKLLAKEEEIKEEEEDRKKKDFLLAKMKEIDSQTTGNKVPPALQSPVLARRGSQGSTGSPKGSPRKDYIFRHPDIMLHNGLPSHDDISVPALQRRDSSNDRFGEYSPTTRRALTRDNRKTDLMANLFGSNPNMKLTDDTPANRTITISSNSHVKNSNPTAVENPETSVGSRNGTRTGLQHSNGDGYLPSIDHRPDSVIMSSRNMKAIEQKDEEIEELPI